MENNQDFIKIKNIHKNILFRCSNNNYRSFHRYGGRGVTVCDEWKTFILFYEWAINNGYKDGLSIDRINNDGNYEPNNCRWANRTIQARNTCKIQINNTSGYRGVYLYKRTGKYITQIRVNYKRINIGTFNTALEAAKAYDKYVTENNLEHTKNF